jgi:hypothetical protein
LNLFASAPPDTAAVKSLYLGQITIDAARSAVVGRVVEEYDVADARHPQLADAAVFLPSMNVSPPRRCAAAVRRAASLQRHGANG